MKLNVAVSCYKINFCSSYFSTSTFSKFNISNEYLILPLSFQFITYPSTSICQKHLSRVVGENGNLNTQEPDIRKVYKYLNNRANMCKVFMALY
jgi:hypothetical protein